MLDDDGVMFGHRTIGTRTTLPKKFKDYWEAIVAGPHFAKGSAIPARRRSGPYVPASLDIADLAESSFRAGRRAANWGLWKEQFQHLKDPSDGAPIVVKSKEVMRATPVEDPETGKQTTEQRSVWVSPDDRYQVLDNDDHLSVKRGFAKAFNNVLSTSRVPDFEVKGIPVGHMALRGSAMLKHGLVLVGDIFHPGRLMRYAGALSGEHWWSPPDRKSVGWEKGLAALSWRPEDIQKGVDAGLMSQQSADWALEKAISWREGRIVNKISRGGLAQIAIERGFNATKVGDALMRDAVRSIPLLGETWHDVLGPLNRLVFNRITPGLMVNSLVTNFERVSKQHPEIPSDVLLKDVIRDTNAMYGNMGRQGIFHDPTYSDIANILLLAPRWREGLFFKDFQTLSRATMGPASALARKVLPENMSKHITYRQGVPTMGTTGRAMVRGMLAYFAFAQVANLISRGKFTWQNPEEGHKMDAIIDIGGGHQVALPTLSVFGEVLHDFVRLFDRSGSIYDAMGSMAVNALGPVGRFWHTIITGEDYRHQKITSDVRRTTQAAGELSPAPISVATPVRAVAHGIAPGHVSPPAPGQLMVRLAGLTGEKWRPMESLPAQMGQKAQKFLRDNKLKPETGRRVVWTDEPSTAKLRAAVANDDLPEFKSVYHDLLKTKKDWEINQSMRNWASAPFTRSSTMENRFKSSLTPEEMDLYQKAMMDKQMTYMRFANDYLPKVLPKE